jgi:hypothetical protein
MERIAAQQLIEAEMAKHGLAGRPAAGMGAHGARSAWPGEIAPHARVDRDAAQN